MDKKLKALGITSTKGFGINYDDPKTTLKEQCRSFVGNIVEDMDIDKIDVLQLNGLKVDSVPKANAVLVEFPIKNRMSYMTGPMKVYPVISKHMMDKKYSSELSFEVYDNIEHKIMFAMQYK